MAYQRWSDGNHFYVWASDYALHVWPCGEEDHQINFEHGTPGVADNAVAVFKGLYDFLQGEGFTIKIDKKTGELNIKKEK